MRSAGDNDSTAVKASDDQLAARRAIRAKHPRVPRKRPRGSVVTDAPPIDPSLGTGLIDNIICEPDGECDELPSASADEVLDRYGSGNLEGTSLPAHAASVEHDGGRSADDELDEIELQLRQQGAKRAIEPVWLPPRGSADLTADVKQIRAPRRSRAWRSVERHRRAPVWARTAAILAVALILGCGAIIAQPGGVGHHRAVRNQTLANLRAATPTAGQLTTAAHLRALIAIKHVKSAAVRVAREHTGTRRARRGSKLAARTKQLPRRRASQHASHPPAPATGTGTTSAAPTAEGASVTSTPSTSSSQQPHPSGAAGPTGGIGSLSGGCSPQCG